jgi:hypothetical protein
MTDALGFAGVVSALLTGPRSLWDRAPAPCTCVCPLGLEQSNTSVVVNGSTLVKFYRRLTPGDSPTCRFTVHCATPAPGMSPNSVGICSGAGTTPGPVVA